MFGVARFTRGLRGVAMLAVSIPFILLFLPILTLFSMTDVRAVSQSGNNAQIYTGNADTTNAYDYGYCTFWVAERRIQIGRPIPGHWGDAHDWDTSARAAGYSVNTVPSVGAIWQSDMAPLGHVAFVEAVYADGSIKVSEMNWQGWDVMDKRTFSSSQAQSGLYIH